MSWDDRFISLCELIASWSKDPGHKIGAVIVGQDNEVRSLGFNGFPRGVNDNALERYERPGKYLWAEHAERNAIYNAARMGTALSGCRIYVNWFPCMNCARAIIQAGIKEVICKREDLGDPNWATEFAEVPQMLAEGGVTVRFI